jgi:hypothetical protein
MSARGAGAVPSYGSAMSLNSCTSALAVTAAAALLGAAAAVPAAARTADPAVPAPVAAPQSLPAAIVLPAPVRPAAPHLQNLPGITAVPPALPHTHCVLTLHRADAPTARCGAAAETREARAGTLLMTWYADPGYGGDTADVRSIDGPCDAGGSGVSDIGGALGRGWDHAISSFRVFGSCAIVQGFEDNRYAGETRTWVGDQRYVGDDWNDRISSLVVRG